MFNGTSGSDDDPAAYVQRSQLLAFATRLSTAWRVVLLRDNLKSKARSLCGWSWSQHSRASSTSRLVESLRGAVLWIERNYCVRSRAGRVARRLRSRPEALRLSSASPSPSSGGAAGPKRRWPWPGASSYGSTSCCAMRSTTTSSAADAGPNGQASSRHAFRCSRGRDRREEPGGLTATVPVRAFSG